MAKTDRLRVRLLKPHYRNEAQIDAGAIIEVEKDVADALVDAGAAEIFVEKKQGPLSPPNTK